MARVFKGFDFLLDFASAVAWGFGGYVLGNRLISDQAGGLLGLAVFISVLAVMLGTNLQEQRMARLIAGVCPGCRERIAVEHRHRRWDGERKGWQTPLTSWDCARCGYSHSEAWACPTCPEPD
jgi:hypothetical protein